MTWQPLRFTVTTPMFLGRGETRADTFRIPELRGALRFWFRALAAPLAGNNVQLLAELESAVFGTAGDATRPAAASSPVRFRLHKDTPLATPRDNGGRDPLAPEWLELESSAVNGVGYLLGPALFQAGNKTQGSPPRVKRSYIPPEREGVLGVDPGPYGDVLACCLWALATFGGLGARVRRGFGGLTFHVDDLAQLSPELKQVLRLPGRQAWEVYQRAWLCRVQQVLTSSLQQDARCARVLGRPTASDADREEPARYPQFVVGTHCSLPPKGRWDTWWKALHAVGVLFREHRASEERSHKLPYKRRVTPEYPKIRKVIEKKQQQPLDFPLGSFGLPIVFTKDLVADVDGMRRASPLWIRPVQVPSKAQVPSKGDWAVLCHAFYAEFLPDGCQPRLVRSIEVPHKKEKKEEVYQLHLDGELVTHRLGQWFNDFRSWRP